MGQRRLVTAAVVGVLGVGLLAGCGPRQPWRSELVSVGAGGADAANGATLGARFSPDGSTLLLVSDADDLGPTDTNGRRDVYRRDVASGAVTLVSRNAAGDDSAAGTAEAPVFSPDGGKIAYLSDAPDVVAGGTTAGVRQVYVHDLATGATTLVTADGGGLGTGSGDGDSFGPAFSPDGGQVVFESRATNLAAGDTNGAVNDVFVHDLTTGVTEIVSRDATGAGTGDGHSDGGSFALGGTAVVFGSQADDLVAGDGNGTDDVFVRDLATGTTALVSADATGTGSANGQSLRPVVGPDGDTVAFPSSATDLGPIDTYEAYDIYLRDLVSGDVTLVSAPPGGGFVGDFFDPVFSPDGSRVAFRAGPGIAVRDLAGDAVEWVSAGVDGGGGDSSSSAPVFSPDGTRIAFDSRSGNLGPVDTNGGDDVYVRDLASGTTTLVSANADGDDSADGDSAAPAFSPDGRRIAFRSTADDLGPTDTNGTFDAYVATLTGADLAVTLSAAPDPVAPGGTVTYRVDVVDDGPDPGEDVTVALLLPTGVTALGATPSTGTCDPPPPAEPRLVTCALGDLAPGGGAGEQVVVTAEVPASAPTGSTLTALAAVSSPTVDAVHPDNAATITVTVG